MRPRPLDSPVIVTVRMVLLVVLAWVLVAAACAAGFVVLRNNGREDCIARQEGRAAVRSVVGTVKDLVVLTGAPIKFTAVPGYEDLDETMQRYLANIQEASAGSNFQEEATARLDQALIDLPPIACS